MILATVNKDQFLELIQPIRNDVGVSITAANGTILISCFSQGISCKLEAYVVRSGQVFLKPIEWRAIVARIQSARNSMVDINIRSDKP